VREEVIAGTPNLDAAVSSSRTRDDRVLSGTRVVVYVIVSFLVLAFAVCIADGRPVSVPLR
jgi:t-SNARE complex subunit (syntaxin)